MAVKRGMGAWLRAFALRDIDKGMAQIRAGERSSTLPLGSAWLLRADQSIDLIGGGRGEVYGSERARPRFNQR